MTDSNEDVVLDAIANQVKALEELSPEELEVKLGLQPVEKFTGKSRRMNDDEKDAYDNWWFAFNITAPFHIFPHLPFPSFLEV